MSKKSEEQSLEKKAKAERARKSAAFYAGLPAAAHRFTGPAFDRTSEYENLMHVADVDAALAELIPRLEDYELLFLPGFLSDFIMATDKQVLRKELQALTHLGVYFDEQLEWLAEKSEGRIRARRLDLEGAAIPLVNAEIIRMAVMEAKKPVLFVGHSKGGIDALEFLIQCRIRRRYRPLLKKIAGLVAVQSPFFGSPVAGYLTANELLREVSSLSLEKIGGNVESLEIMTRHARCRDYNDRKAHISKILRKIPVLSFASHNDKSEGAGMNTFLFIRASRNRMEEMGIPNDGLVPLNSAVLPGSRYIKVSHVDHAVTVMESLFLDFDRKRFMFTMLQMMLGLVEDFPDLKKPNWFRRLPRLRCME